MNILQSLPSTQEGYADWPQKDLKDVVELPSVHAS
jgi:hypothetical protein